jgi:hypothetical protein
MINSAKHRWGFVTIDVEPDNVWANTQSRMFENMKHLPNFHYVCREYGIRPTYLVTWSVASDPECGSILETLLSYGDCEVGIHPHLWETPPILPQDKENIAWTGNNYTPEALEAKLTNLTELLTKRFSAPVSHRAGRWGMDPRQVALLSRLGIAIDSSVTPGIDWSITGAPDYSDAPLSIYELDNFSLIKPGKSQVFEVPCTVVPGWRIGGWGKSRYFRTISRLLSLNPHWLRVSPQSSATSLENVCVWAYKCQSHLNIMSHSSEFMAGGSPYWRTETEVTYHLEMYKRIFSWWNRHNVTSITLSELLPFIQNPEISQ